MHPRGAQVDRDGTDITAAFARPLRAAASSACHRAQERRQHDHREGHRTAPAPARGSSSPTIRSADRCCSARRPRRGSARRRRRSPQPATRRPRTRAACRPPRPTRSATSRPSTSSGTARRPLGRSTAAPAGPDARRRRRTPANSCFQPYIAGHHAGRICRHRRRRRRRHRAVHRARRARHAQPRHLRHRRAVRPDASRPGRRPRRSRSGTARCVYSYGASTGQPRLQFRTEQNWADDTALSRGFMVVDNSLTDSLYNSNRMLDRRDDDDDEGAHRRQLRRDQVHDGQRLLRRLDRPEHGGLDLSRACSTASSRAATTPTRSPPASRSPTACCWSTSTSRREWQALMAGLTQAQINAKKAAINGHRDQPGCQAGTTRSASTTSRATTYRPWSSTQRPARSRRPARRATTAACRRRWSTTRSPTRPARAAAIPTSPR